MRKSVIFHIILLLVACLANGCCYSNRNQAASILSELRGREPKIKRTLCKICGIHDLKNARLAARFGADLIGLPIANSIKEKDTLQEIIQAIKAEFPQVSTVAVTGSTAINPILRIAETQPSYIQLHSLWPEERLIKLKRLLKQDPAFQDIKLIVVVVLKDKVSLEQIRWVSKLSDIILFDSSLDGGSGQQIESDLLLEARRIAQPNPVFVAGGLDETNVQEIIDNVGPEGVDAESRLEMPGPPGTKNPRKLENFIRVVKNLG